MSDGLAINGRVAPISDTLGVELVSREEGRATLRYPVKAEFTNPMGQLQGGMYAVLMDQAMAMASGGLATATMQFSIFRSATSGFLVVSAEVIRRGRRLIYVEAEIRDEDGNLVARGNQHGVPRDASSPTE